MTKFPIWLQPGLRPILFVLGVRPGETAARIDGERLEAAFGLFGADTPLANIARWDITGALRRHRALPLMAVRWGCGAPSGHTTSPSAGPPTAESA